MKSLIACILLLAPTAVLAQSAASRSPTVEDLTRALNTGPARAVSQSATQAPAAATSRSTNPPQSGVQSPPPPSLGSIPASLDRAVARVPVSPLPPPAATAPARSCQTPRRAAPPATGVLSANAIAELPFRIDLPAGVQLAAVSTNVGSRVWAVRRGPRTLAMIFAGSGSQFPIYDGDQVTVAGRTSVVVTEGNRRIAMEHLFQRGTEPAEIHIWVMTTSGADRDLAEQIAQTLDVK